MLVRAEKKRRREKKKRKKEGRKKNGKRGSSLLAQWVVTCAPMGSQDWIGRPSSGAEVEDGNDQLRSGGGALRRVESSSGSGSGSGSCQNQEQSRASVFYFIFIIVPT